MKEETKSQTAIRQGLHVETFLAFREFAASHPEEVKFGFEASGAGEGRVLHTLARTGPYLLGGKRIDRAARQYVYHFGAHKEVEAALGFTEPTDREETVEVALAALTGCINAAVSASAAIRGIDLVRLQTDVRISWDPATFLHLRDPEEEGKAFDPFGPLKIELTIVGNDIDADDLVYLEESVKRSAVFNLITGAHACTIDVGRVRQRISN